MFTKMDKSVTQIVFMLLAMASIFIIIAGIQGTAYIVNSILLAAIITIAVYPIPKRLIDRGVNRGIALVAGLLVVLLVMGMLLMLTIVSVQNISTSQGSEDDASSEQVDEDEDSKQEAGEEIAENAVSSVIDDNAGALESVEAMLEPYIGENTVDNLLQYAQSILTQALSIILQGALQFGSVLLIFVFMLSAVVTTPMERQLEMSTSKSFAEKINKLISDVQHYLTITTIVNGLVGIGNALLFFAFGVPFAILWGILSWVTGYIPVIGFWIALIPAAIMTLLSQGFETMIIVSIGYILVNAIVQNIVQPKLMGDGLSISPLVVFISVLCWGWVLCGVGAILAIPLTLLVLTILESFEATRWIATLARLSPDNEEEEKEASEQLRESREEAQQPISSNSGGSQNGSSTTELDVQSDQGKQNI